MPRQSTKWMAALALVAALMGFGGAARADKAPDFSLPDLNGKSVRLSEINKSEPVIVSFWATWCQPCPQEMQHLQRFYETYAKSGLKIVAISIDGPKTVSKVKPFVTGRSFTFPVLLDTNNDVKRIFQVSAVPTVCVLKPGGEVTFHHVGYKPGDEVALEQEIRKVLGLSESKEGDAGAPADSSKKVDPQTDSSSTDSSSDAPAPAERTPSETGEAAR
ncbi:MAG: TlpA family protein disulfide reductase [Candidatus Eisenbacteria bacterium]|nr:TlpA family protein disulfide reductase [Candidatus Eisenbacteria bacterium]